MVRKETAIPEYCLHVNLKQCLRKDTMQIRYFLQNMHSNLKTTQEANTTTELLSLLVEMDLHGIATKLDDCIELWRVQYIGIGRPRG
jgi:hypothetical protein